MDLNLNFRVGCLQPGARLGNPAAERSESRVIRIRPVRQSLKFHLAAQ
jgi:hypothetical protein